MMLDQEQGQLWTAHGKALGDELGAMFRFARGHVSLGGILRTAQGLGSVLATVLAGLAGLAMIGIAALPGVAGVPSLF